MWNSRFILRTTRPKRITKVVVTTKKASADLNAESTEDEFKIVPLPAKAPSSSTNRANVQSTHWTDEQLLAELQHIDREASANIIQLFKDDNTIPFICRYRRELIGNLSPDQ